MRIEIRSRRRRRRGWNNISFLSLSPPSTCFPSLSKDCTSSSHIAFLFTKRKKGMREDEREHILLLLSSSFFMSRKSMKIKENQKLGRKRGKERDASEDSSCLENRRAGKEVKRKRRVNETRVSILRSSQERERFADLHNFFFSNNWSQSKSIKNRRRGEREESVGREVVN